MTGADAMEDLLAIEVTARQIEGEQFDDVAETEQRSVIDFAVFNSSMESLRNQPLITVEAKRENRLVKEKELLSAHYHVASRF